MAKGNRAADPELYKSQSHPECIFGQAEDTRLPIGGRSTLLHIISLQGYSAETKRDEALHLRIMGNTPIMWVVYSS